MLDHIIVETQGVKMPLSRLAVVSVLDPKTLSITPYDPDVMNYNLSHNFLVDLLMLHFFFLPLPCLQLKCFDWKDFQNFALDFAMHALLLDLTV